MNDELPVELLEAQRRIKASQTEIKASPPAESIEQACQRLKKTLEAIPRVAYKQDDDSGREATVLKLQGTWNAPKRHLARTTFDSSAVEWSFAFDKLCGKAGKGFTAALVGTRGPGKTQMGVELMRFVTGRLLKSAYYCTAMDYFMRIKDAFSPDREERQRDAQLFFAKPALLVIDEVNVRSDSKWEDNMLADLIGKRYNALLDTLLISNETVASFEDSIGPSILDRLNETGGIIECTWKSFRA